MMKKSIVGTVFALSAAIYITPLSSGAINLEDSFNTINDFVQYCDEKKNEWSERNLFASFMYTSIPSKIFLFDGSHLGCFGSVMCSGACKRQPYPCVKLFCGIAETGLFSNIFKFDGGWTKEWNKKFILFFFNLIKSFFNNGPECKDYSEGSSEYAGIPRPVEVSLDCMKSFANYSGVDMTVRSSEKNMNISVDFSKNNSVKKIVFVIPGVLSTYRLKGFRWCEGLQRRENFCGEEVRSDSKLVIKLVNNFTGKIIDWNLYDIQNGSFNFTSEPTGSNLNNIQNGSFNFTDEITDWNLHDILNGSCLYCSHDCALNFFKIVAEVLAKEDFYKKNGKI